MQINFLKNIDVSNKRVLLRADLNVPLQGKNIIQDYRLQSILPSIHYIIKNGGKVILATHIGRPRAEKHTNFFDKNLSTTLLVPWFAQHGFTVDVEPDLLKAEPLSKQSVKTILLLENLRFFNGEKGTEEERKLFAQMLQPLADIYVNDAFALLHRNDCSVTTLPQQFHPQNRSFGFLFEKELHELNKIKESVKEPFMLVLGGNKIKDKIPMLQNFLEHKTPPEKIIIGGAPAYTFLKALGFKVGTSLVDDESVPFAKTFLTEARSRGIEVLLPDDHVVIEDITNIDEITNDSTTKIVATSKIPQNGMCVDIGPQTIQKYCDAIKKAQTIFTNGSMGIYTIEKTALGSKTILESIATSNAYSVAGGGDCIAAIHLFSLQDQFAFLSTGGGATLAFLGTKNPFAEFDVLKVE